MPILFQQSMLYLLCAWHHDGTWCTADSLILTVSTKHYFCCCVSLTEPGVSFITIAYAQNRAWKVPTQLVMQTCGFLKPTWWENVHISTQIFTHMYKYFGDGKVAMQTWGGELKPDYSSTSSFILNQHFSCARATFLFHTNLLIAKYIKQLTANYVQFPFNIGVTEPSHYCFLIISSYTVCVSSNCCS